MKKLMILSATLLLFAVCARAVEEEERLGTCTCVDGSTGMLVTGGKCVKDGLVCRNAPEGQNTMATGSVQRTAKPS